LGYTREELLGLSVQDIEQDFIAGKHKEKWKQMVPGVPILLEGVHKCKDGTTFPVEVRIGMFESGGSKIFLTLVRDITERKRAEESVLTSEKRYRQIVDNADDIIYGVDNRGHFTFISPVAARITGYFEHELLSRHYLDLVSPAYRKDTERFYRLQLVRRRQNTYYEFPIVSRDGTEVWLGQNLQLVMEGERVVGFQAVARDITERKRAEEALRESEGRYRSLVEFTEDPVYLIDRNKRYLFINEKYLSRLGLPRDHVIGRQYSEFHSRGDNKEFSGHIEQVLATGRFVQYEHRSRSDGRYFLRTLSPVQEPDGRIETVTVISKDITERKQAEKKLTYMATHDFLTGLPNRVLFNDRLTLALAQARRHHQKLCVMLLDLDYLKDINDTLGHSVGDKLLCIVGERLTGLLRTSDTIARMGGDEFLLLLTEISRGNNVTTIAQKILESFRKPFAVDDHELMITTSIGIAIFPDDGEDADTLVKNADIAMYRAKERGRDNFQCYTPT
jgi:diguanylate cyclase (GGDEF)-like protein/PAS domain S-box-containing protein